MKTFVIENTWLPGMNHGWGNGYVIIPKGHALHGKHYDEIDVDVHGGLTFSEPAKECKEWHDLEKDDLDGWIVGFDTAHYSDNMANWSKARVVRETKRLKNQLENL